MTTPSMTTTMDMTMNHQMSGMHDGGTHQQMGHGGITSLIHNMGATHIAVNNGSWFDASTWKNGKVPSNGAKVLISEGVTVTYNQESDARINTVAIKGRLKFAENRSTKLVVETMLNGPTGTLDIGTSDKNFVAADKTAKIVFTSDRAIGDLKAWDPTQLGKGLVSHGKVNIFGADKADSVTLAGDAIAGDNFLTLSQQPSGWRVGDQIVLGGTNRNNKGSHEDNSYFQDEVLIIREIKGNKVYFTNEGITTGNNTVLKYNHVRPDVPEKDELKLYVGNTTRNVSFETENGETVPLENRAHVMFMHNPDVRVNNAGFYELGRSDKSKVVDDVDMNVDGSIGKGTNPRGRYALHFHRTGADDLSSTAAIAKGNAVVGSPGWGIVHHDSHANVEENVVFDVVGSGIAAETGNEIGVWKDNIVIKTTGFNHAAFVSQRKASEARFDFGSNGEAYWVQGAAQIQMQDNIAVSSKKGLVIFGDSLKDGLFKDKDTIKINSLPKNLQRLFPENQLEVDLNDIPLQKLTGFKAYNANTGINFWGHLTDQDGYGLFHGVGRETRGAHDGRSLVSDFQLWGIHDIGVSTQYSSNIDFVHGLVLGSNQQRLSSPYGLTQNVGATSILYDDITVKGFGQGIRLQRPVNAEDREYAASTIQNSTLRNNQYNLNKYGANSNFSTYVNLRNNDFQSLSSNQSPIAEFSSEAVGGLAVRFDARSSYDVDPIKEVDGRIMKGIAAYGWDFDNDGNIDHFGSTTEHFFEKTGAQQVNLTVWDNQGRSSTLQKRIEVQKTPYGNAFLGSDFSDGQADLKNHFGGQWVDKGWYTINGQVEDESVKLSGSPFDASMGQIVYDNRVRREKQTFSFRLKNIEGTENKPAHNNEVSIKLWGVDGQFSNNPVMHTGPVQIGTLPMERQLLFSETFGGDTADFFDWQTFTYEVDLGVGYEYLFADISADNGNNAGDSIFIDDISLTGTGDSVQTGISETNNSDSNDLDIPLSIASLMGTPGSMPSLVIKAQSVVNLSFNEGKGDIAKDLSEQGLENSGLLRSGTTWTEGISNKAVAFDNENDGIEIKTSKDINASIHSERTVGFWFKADELTGSNKRQVLYEEGGGARGLNIYIDDGKLYTGGWNRPNHESGWKGNWLSTDQVEMGQWQHVALVLEGTDEIGAGALKGYLNGELFGSAEGSQLWRHTNGIGIGRVNSQTRFHDGQSNNGSYAFVGAIDELAIFNDGLMAGSI
ncbi:MAG: G8 domain-containing protein [Cyanobacteria bacterium J06560_6]